MYDFNDGLPFGGLLEQLNCAAIAAENGFVCEFNSAAHKLIPSICEGDSVTEAADGRVEICHASFEATRYTAGGFTVYTMPVPLSDIENIWPFIENTSLAMLEPLNSAFTALKVINDKIDECDMKGIKKYNAVLNHSQYQLRHIAENLRELGELSLSPEALDPKLFDIDSLCRDAVKTVSMLIAKKKINMDYSSEGAHVIIFADRNRVERMLLDVLSNSIKNCSEGNSISVSLREHNGYFQITVKDDGKGMNNDVLLHVFDSYNLPTKPVSEPRGLGLSLAVARNVALRHGGSLVVESTPEKGTSVVISLPIAPEGKHIDLKTSSVIYGGNSMKNVLTSLSDVLDYTFYTPPYQ